MKLFTLVLDHPKKTLSLIGLVTSTLAFSLTNLSYDFTIEQLFAKDKEETKAYFDFQEEFSREDNVLLLVHKIPNSYSNEFSNDLDSLVSNFRNSLYFLEIISLADSYSLDKVVEHKSNGIEGISSRLLNMTSSDSAYGAIWLKLKDNFNSFDERKVVIDFIKSSTSNLNWDWTYSGLPVVRNTYVDYMIQDNIKFIPPVALILIISLSLLFRNWIYVILPLLTVLITAIWILGVMSVSGKGLNVMTYMVPTLLFIIGVSDSIHFLSRLNIYLVKGIDIKNALKLSIKDMGIALFLTSLTTAIGFMALLYSSISIVQEFGVFIATGVFIAYLLTLTFIPASLMLLKDVVNIKSLSSKNTRLTLLKKFSNLVKSRPKSIVFISILFTSLSLIGASKVATGSSLLSDLHPKSSLYVDLKNVEKWFGGILPMEVIIVKNDSADIAIYDSLIIGHVKDFQEYLFSLFPHSNWISLPIILEEVFYEINPLEEFPPDQEMIDQLFVLTQGETEGFINFDENKIRISGMLPDLSSDELASIKDSIMMFTKHNFPNWLSVKITGTMPVALSTNNYLIIDLFSGFGLAFIFISIVMGLLFLSVRIGFISMLPNLIPIIFAAGYLGFAGIPIRPPIAITFSICLGIAVDDSLHFLFRFWQERKKNSNMDKAISNTIETTGLAMLTSTIVLVSGFIVITVSTFIPTSQFGVISAITLTVALITDITLLPALLYLFPVQFIKDKNND